MIIDIALFRTMGDVLMATPIVHAIKLKYPDSKIRFFTEPAYVGILEGNPEIDQIIPLATATYLSVYEYTLTHEKADHICKLGMANHYDTCWHHNEETSNQHMIDWYTSRAGLDLPVPLPDRVVRLYESKEDVKNAEQFINLDRQYIVMHTTSLLETKNWPIQYFNHLAQMLTAEYNLPILQIGGPSDQIINGAIDCRGKTDIKVTKVLIDNADFYVGIDSGSSYLAGASGKPTFIIMGSSQGIAQVAGGKGPLVGPIGTNVTYIEPIRPNDINCRPIPCINHCALKKPCIETIDPMKVMSIIKSAVPLTGNINQGAGI